MHNNHVEAFVQYFQDGCKERDTGRVGIEIEHFVVDRQKKSIVSYYGENGIGALLGRLSCFGNYDSRIVSQGHVLGLAKDTYAISIEPAAQLEVSIMPLERIEEIQAVYGQFTGQVEPLLTAWDYELVTAGYCPLEKSEELALIPKKRYEYMNRYFEEIGMYGRCMMRGTASVQCAVDYADEEDFVKTYRTAVALGPLLALLTDNAAVFQGKPWEKHMLRTYIWEQVDKSRCGIVPGTFDEDFGFAAYAKYLYETGLIFMENEKSEPYYVGKKSLKDILEETDSTVQTGKTGLTENSKSGITLAQMEHAMSIVFPDVRLKQYIEIRVADSMPPAYIWSYAALIKGLFRNRKELYQLYEHLQQYTQLGRMTEAEVQQGKAQLIGDGYEGMIYGKKAFEWLEEMLALARVQLPENEKHYLEPMEKLVQTRRSVRDR